MSNNFQRDLLIIGLIGIASYINDLYHNHKLYAKCLNVPVQISHLFHHIFISFLYLSFLSNNRMLLTINLIIIVIVMIHWRCNKNKCAWSQHYQRQCQVKTGLNTFLDCGMKDKGRRMQLIMFVLIVSIIFIKLFYYR
jgi:hypothetical protein